MEQLVRAGVVPEPNSGHTSGSSLKQRGDLGDGDSPESKQRGDLWEALAQFFSLLLESFNAPGLPPFARLTDGADNESLKGGEISWAELLDIMDRAREPVVGFLLAQESGGRAPGGQMDSIGPERSGEISALGYSKELLSTADARPPGVSPL